VKKYNSVVDGNPKVEMIHVSLDRDESAAEDWAVKEKFPWYTVLPDDVSSSGLREYKTTNFVPEYALLNANGERLGSGSEVFDQVKDLIKK
jgi:Thioredoxin-like